MGVHVTKIQSLTLDDIGTSQLLIARYMTNDKFNQVMQAKATVTDKIIPTDNMSDKEAFIKAKYKEKKFVNYHCKTSEEALQKLEAAIEQQNLYDVLQYFCETIQYGIGKGSHYIGKCSDATVLDCDWD